MGQGSVFLQHASESWARWSTGPLPYNAFFRGLDVSYCGVTRPHFINTCIYINSKMPEILKPKVFITPGAGHSFCLSASAAPTVSILCVAFDFDTKQFLKAMNTEISLNVTSHYK